MNKMLNPFFYASNPQLLAYEKAWIDYVNNEIKPLENIISEEIFASWENCRENGLDPLSTDVPIPLGGNELSEKRRACQSVLAVAEKYMHIIFSIVNDTDISVDFIDADGYLIRSLNSATINKLVEKTNTGLGYNFSEKSAGTSAISLAIKHKKAMQTSGAQFFLQRLHPWTCAAAPILDASGEILGVIAIGGNYESVHKHTLGMVIAATSAVENEMFIKNINAQLESNMHQRTELFSMVTDGAVYAINGIIQQVNQQICTLLEEKEEYLIGRKLYESIRATPNLQKIFESEGKGYENREIVIEGKKTFIKCIYDMRIINEGDDIIELFLVTRVDEIKSLAEKITNVADATFEDIVYISVAMNEKIEIAKKAAHFGSRVLIEGESGTGKEILAQAIHNESSRRYNSFVAIDCGAIPRELFESEMFGYVQGAFTGARSGGKIGLLELADKGTVFLDEIGNMPIEMQAKLLRVLQEGSITKIGSVNRTEIDIRVIAATNMDLRQAVKDGTFREDLYYRINVINIEIPPLRNRPEDIPVLMKYFIKKMEKSNTKATVSSKAMRIIMNYDWPGNIRQLQNFVERLLIFASGKTISEQDLPHEIKGPISHHNLSAKRTLDNIITNYIKTTLAEQNGNVTKTAEILDVSRATIYNKLGKKKK